MKSTEAFPASQIPEVRTFFLDRRWVESTEGEDGNIVFTKSLANTVVADRKSGEEFTFLTLSKKKIGCRPTEVCEALRTHFQSVGYGLVASRNVADAQGQTDLVVAGVQMYDDIIHHNQPLRPEKVFVAQPCVRTQFQSIVGSRNGFSTSFVNVCTEQMGMSLEEHLQSVDCWLTALSKLGLHMNDFRMVLRQSKQDWGTGEFGSLELFFYYGDLQLGDAAYLIMPQAQRAGIPISDIGFGLERIVWAINKTPHYFDSLLPYTAEGEREMFDLCRTISLLTLSGVQPANKGPGWQFRRFAKLLSEKYFGVHIFDVMSHYYRYWAAFSAESLPHEDSLMLARLELERFLNLRICAELRCPPPRNETTDAYLDRLVYTHGTSICAVRRAIRVCKP